MGFSASHLIFVTIKDLKYYLQPGPAYLFNSVAGCCQFRNTECDL